MCLNDQKYAIVYANDFSTWQMCSMSIKSARHFCPGISIFILSYGKPDHECAQLCQQLNVECIDISQLFDEKFPFFKKHGKDYHVLSNGAKYPKITFARFLVPYIDALKQYEKVLYLDDDTVACQSLDGIFLSDSSKWITVGFDGQSPKQHISGLIYWNIHRYDYWKMLKHYACAGVLMFDMKAQSLCEYDKFISRIGIGQEKIIAWRKEFLTCQDMLNLYCDFQLTKGKKVAAKRWPISEDTCIYHYYSIKRKEHFKQLLSDMLSQANKDVSWIN